MKAMTFISMMLLAISGATAQSVVNSEPFSATASNGILSGTADFTTQRICMRCRPGG